MSSRPGNPRPSGRFVLRVDPGLHEALRRAAAEEEISLNDYCIRKLAAPGRPHAGATALVGRAADLFGEDLIGVVLFGSWARGEAMTGSDVDALIVLGRGTRISRELYRRWDERALTWEGRRIEPHFVRLEPDAPLTSVWAEAAIDGVVLFERGWSLSMHLARTRRAIAAGKLSRRVVHGQPYWAEAG